MNPNFEPEACKPTESSHGDRSVSPSERPEVLSGSKNFSETATAVQKFSIEQLQCPVIIEVFCGSARVTASLRALGVKSACGVDHDTTKAVAAAKNLDLSTHSGQEILLTWLKSPMVVGVFIAPLVAHALWPDAFN